MKKIIALLTAAVFTFTLGAAFAQETSKAPAAPEKKEEKASAKTKRAKKHGKKKAVKKAETAAPAVAAPATK